MPNNFTLCFKDVTMISHEKYKEYNSTPTIFKVFLHLISSINKDNTVIITQTKLAKEFGVRQCTVSKAIKNLIQLGIIIKLKRKSYYRLNPSIAIATKTSEQEAMIEKYKNEAMEARIELNKFKLNIDNHIAERVKHELENADNNKSHLKLIK